MDTVCFLNHCSFFVVNFKLTSDGILETIFFKDKSNISHSFDTLNLDLFCIQEIMLSEIFQELYFGFMKFLKIYRNFQYFTSRFRKFNENVAITLDLILVVKILQLVHSAHFSTLQNKIRRRILEITFIHIIIIHSALLLSLNCVCDYANQILREADGMITNWTNCIHIVDKSIISTYHLN